MGDTLFFADAEAFSAWLDANHAHASEAWLLFHKKGSGRASQTLSEVVDVALCFGWIDGLRKGVDGDSYKVRFTPRKQGSVWSAANAAAWQAFQAFAPSYMRDAVWWVMSAKREETRVKRIDALISSSFAGQRVPPLRPRSGTGV